jgi:hypothetical protein
VKLPLAGRIAGLVLAGLSAATVLAACGGGSSSTATPSGDASGGASGIQAYVSCLSQHGVTLPSRAPGARGTRSPGARPSFSRGPRPSGSAGGGFGGGGFGGGGFSGGGFGGGVFNDPSNPPTGVSASTWSAALTACKSLQPTATGNGTNGGFNNSQFTAYRNCLQSHGVTFSAGPNGLSTSDPKVAAALKTCAPLRPTGGARPSGAPTPAPSATG